MQALRDETEQHITTNTTTTTAVSDLFDGFLESANVVVVAQKVEEATSEHVDIEGPEVAEHASVDVR